MRLKRLFKIFKPPRGFRLTKQGKIFFVFLFAIIVISMLTGNNLLFLILAFMLSFMIVSGIESERNIRYLEIERVFPAEIYAKSPSRIGYYMRNTKKASDRLKIHDRDILKVPYLPKGPGEILYNDCSFEKRGSVRLGSLTVSTTFPYGLFEKSITFELDDEAIVFPEPLPLLSATSTGVEDMGKGRGSDSISHVRAYVPGDPGSIIVWKKMHLGLLSRVVEGGSGMKGIIMLMPGGDLENKLSEAAFLVNEFFKAGSQFGLVVNRYFSGLGNSRNHKIGILQELARVESIGEPVKEAYGEAKIIYL
jgi:hypothetical protein